MQDETTQARKAQRLIWAAVFNITGLIVLLALNHPQAIPAPEKTVEADPLPALYGGFLRGEGVPRPVWDTASSCQAARDDQASIPDAQTRLSTRYLTIYDVAKEDRDWYMRVLQFCTNSLNSEKSTIRVLRPVTGTDGALLAFDARWFSKDTNNWLSVWEKFTQTSNWFFNDYIPTDGSRGPPIIQGEPATRKKPGLPLTRPQPTLADASKTRLWEGTQPWPEDGKLYAAGSFTYTPSKAQALLILEQLLAVWKDEQDAASLLDSELERAATPAKATPFRVGIPGIDSGLPRQRAVGSWIPTGWVQDLTAMSGSIMPVAMGGDFIFLVMDSTKSNFYYDFLKIKNENDLQKIADGDFKVGEKYESDRQGTVIFSGVTQNNRRLSRMPTRVAALGGYYWISTDTKDSIGAKNFLNHLLDRGEENFDATEQIFSLPNLLQGYGLFNNKGVRADSAPDFIASDRTSPNNDARVRNFVSCVRCHEPGINRFKSVYPQLRQSVNVLTIRPLALDRLDQLYGDDLNQYFDEDYKKYASATKKATGWMPEESSRNFARAYHDWEDTKCDIQTAAVLAGVSPEFLLKILRREGETLAIGALTADDPIPITRTQLNEVFPEIATRVATNKMICMFAGGVVYTQVGRPPEPTEKPKLPVRLLPGKNPHIPPAKMEKDFKKNK